MSRAGRSALQTHTPLVGAVSSLDADLGREMSGPLTLTSCSL